MGDYLEGANILGISPPQEEGRTLSWGELISCDSRDTAFDMDNICPASPADSMPGVRDVPVSIQTQLHITVNYQQARDPGIARII